MNMKHSAAFKNKWQGNSVDPEIIVKRPFNSETGQTGTFSEAGR
jgi:hypothetical protein